MSEVAPPPVQVWDSPDVQRVSPVRVLAENCGRVLRSFGVEDEHIADTAVLLSPRMIEREYHPDQPLTMHNLVFSSCRVFDPGGSNVIQVNVGSMRANTELDFSPSALLIPGLSQRADLVNMGVAGLEAERAAVRRSDYSHSARKPVICNALVASGLECAAVLAAQAGIIPGPVGYTVLGIVAIGEVWTGWKMGKNAHARATQLRNTYQTWPAQRRALARMQDYDEDPGAPPLIEFVR